MLNENDLSIESLILCLSSFKPLIDDQEPPKLVSSDYNLINSFSKQIVRRIGFTDRQYELAKRKVDDYASYFTFIKDLESVKNRLDIPLREIDRSRWIKIVEHQGSNRLYQAEKSPFIAVRFTFQKKLISAIEKLQNVVPEKPEYDRENKIHYFPYSERALWEIVQALKDKNFELDDLVKQTITKIETFQEQDHIPGVYNLKIKNLNNNAINYIISSIGEPSIENLYQYKDRQEMLGLLHFDDEDLNISLNQLSILSKKIVKRKKFNIFINKSEYDFNLVVSSILELHRFPLLVILPSKEMLNGLSTVHKAFSGIIMPDSQSVVVRMENSSEEGANFNQYIKDYQLNNSVDKNTKIVYTDTNKIPKPLVKDGWSPDAVLLLDSSKPNSKLLSFISSSDLIIHYDSDYSRMLASEIQKI